MFIHALLHAQAPIFSGKKSGGAVSDLLNRAQTLGAAQIFFATEDWLPAHEATHE